MSISSRTIAQMRLLSLDAIDRAGSGHPGVALGLAPVMYGLWADSLRVDPSDPSWFGRDRLVLSGGHASILLYVTLYLAGIQSLKDGSAAISIEDLKHFRRLHSKTAGHPELGLVDGIEATTGPLAQGCTTAVGMAMAYKWLDRQFNASEYELFSNQVFAFVGEGDLMEGLSSEAMSLAGHMQLNNLTWILDRNKISIDGSTDITFTEDIKEKFKACGWRVFEVDGNDPTQVAEACEKTRVRLDKKNTRPTLIIANTVIGFGTPTLEGSHKIHAGSLNAEELKGARCNISERDDYEPFSEDEEVKPNLTHKVSERGAAAHLKWTESFERYKADHPKQAEVLKRVFSNRTVELGKISDYPKFEEDISTRQASGVALQYWAKVYPELLGGSADAGPSTYSDILGSADFATGNDDFYAGRNIHFGVREAAMGAVSNGLKLMGLKPYAATFLSFVDYMLPAVRMSALMKLPTMYLLALDSVAVGGDGPTHQPIEQVSQLRLIPNLNVIRPADAHETLYAWQQAVYSKTTPTALILSRQKLPLLSKELRNKASQLEKGFYTLNDNFSDGSPDIILMASGSEVHLALGVQEELGKKKVRVRVVSCPCFELYEKQDETYKERVLPASVTKRVAIEMGRSDLWWRYVGLQGKVLGIDQFGTAGEMQEVVEHFGFTCEHLVKECQAVLDKNFGKN